jgi:hypothetical protein
MKPVVAAYLARLDARLSSVSNVSDRIRIIDDERWRVDRLERALSDWAACDRGLGSPPTRLSAFDLAVLHGELSLRLETTRDAWRERERETAANARVLRLSREVGKGSPLT